METNRLLISKEQDVRDSSVYAGYLILKDLKKGNVCRFLICIRLKKREIETLPIAMRCML